MQNQTDDFTADEISGMIDLAKVCRGGGDWPDVESTDWHTISVQAGNDVENHSVTVHPAEPSCSDDEHHWTAPHHIVGGITENPGVWGHGGGVTIHEICEHCGTHRHTDTWAQRRDTGEQGLTSVTYAQPDAQPDDDDDDDEEAS